MPIPEVNIFEQDSQRMTIAGVCDDYLFCTMTGMGSDGKLVQKNVHVSRPPGLRRMDYEKGPVEGVEHTEWGYVSNNARSGIEGEVNEIFPPYEQGEEIYVTKKVADPLDDLESYNWACIGDHALNATDGGGTWTAQRYKELTGAGVPISTAKYFIDENRVGRTWRPSGSGGGCITSSDPCVGALAGYEFYMGCTQCNDIVNGYTAELHKIKFVGSCWTGELFGIDAGTGNLWIKLLNRTFKASDGDCYVVKQGPATNADGDHSPIEDSINCPNCQFPGGGYNPWENETWYQPDDTYGYSTVYGKDQPAGECHGYVGGSSYTCNLCTNATASPEDTDCGTGGTASNVAGYCEKEVCLIDSASGKEICGTIMFKSSCRECEPDGETGPSGAGSTGPHGTGPSGTGPLSGAGSTGPHGTGPSGTGPLSGAGSTGPHGTGPSGTSPVPDTGTGTGTGTSPSGPNTTGLDSGTGEGPRCWMCSTIAHHGIQGGLHQISFWGLESEAEAGCALISSDTHDGTRTCNRDSVCWSRAYPAPYLEANGYEADPRECNVPEDDGCFPCYRRQAIFIHNEPGGNSEEDNYEVSEGDGSVEVVGWVSADEIYAKELELQRTVTIQEACDIKFTACTEAWGVQPHQVYDGCFAGTTFKWSEENCA